jgi:hypothetical protein
MGFLSTTLVVAIQTQPGSYKTTKIRPLDLIIFLHRGCAPAFFGICLQGDFGEQDLVRSAENDYYI